MRELPVPPAAARASNAIELVRVWAAEGEQHVTIDVGLWKDPAAWGLMLVDLARHISSAYEEGGTMQRTEALKRIKDALEVEWLNPTDEPTGGFQS